MKARMPPWMCLPQASHSLLSYTISCRLTREIMGLGMGCTASESLGRLPARTIRLFLGNWYDPVMHLLSRLEYGHLRGGRNGVEFVEEEYPEIRVVRGGELEVVRVVGDVAGSVLFDPGWMHLAHVVQGYDTGYAFELAGVIAGKGNHAEVSLELLRQIGRAHV